MIKMQVVLYPKDTEKWKQFTTVNLNTFFNFSLFCIPKILKNESNSQLISGIPIKTICCFVSQRYWKMKAIHNGSATFNKAIPVVLYPKDTEKWKQFTTVFPFLKSFKCCFVSQRYWKMKAIHNIIAPLICFNTVVLYPKDTEKWKQFTTEWVQCKS